MLNCDRNSDEITAGFVKMFDSINTKKLRDFWPKVGKINFLNDENDIKDVLDD